MRPQQPKVIIGDSSREDQRRPVRNARLAPAVKTPAQLEAELQRLRSVARRHPKMSPEARESLTAAINETIAELQTMRGR